MANLSSTSTTLSSFSYALDAVGNRLRVVESTGNRVTWSYDKTYQLKNEQRSGSNSYNITYTYDPVGNRLVVINGGVRTTSTYDAANELTKSQVVAGITTYHLRRGRQPAHQPEPVEPADDQHLGLREPPDPGGRCRPAIVDTFTYNGDGQRVQKLDSTGTTKHVWDGQNILLETDGSNIIQVVYTLQPMLYGNLISQRRSGTTSFYLFDGLGSTTQLANSTGSVTDSYLYDSFGNILLTSGSTTNWFRYVGRLGYYYDTDLNQYYLRAQHLQPGHRSVSIARPTSNIAATEWLPGIDRPLRNANWIIHLCPWQSGQLYGRIGSVVFCLTPAACAPALPFVPCILPGGIVIIAHRCVCPACTLVPGSCISITTPCPPVGVVTLAGANFTCPPAGTYPVVA